jgi:hypothetical protein
LCGHLRFEPIQLHGPGIPSDGLIFSPVKGREIFIIGLARGLKEYRAYLKPGGYLAFTEMCWFMSEPPAEARAYFDNVYPDIRDADEVRRMAADSGYRVIESFNLPDSAWWDDYYTPMLGRIKELKVKNAGVAEAEAVYDACKTEIEMFRQHSKSYGCAFFVLQRLCPPGIRAIRHAGDQRHL